MPEILANFFTAFSDIWLNYIAWILIVCGLLTLFSITTYSIINALIDEYESLKKKIRKYKKRRQSKRYIN